MVSIVGQTLKWSARLEHGKQSEQLNWNFFVWSEQVRDSLDQQRTSSSY